MKVVVLILALAATTLCAKAVAAQETDARPAQRLRGVVIDTTGAPVRGAEVSLYAGTVRQQSVVTGDDGRFSFDTGRMMEGTLNVWAQGFARCSQSWSTNTSGDTEVEMVLAPAPFNEQVTVTATRTATTLGETPASVRVLSSEDLDTTAALSLDDALRQIPGFQLFRRSGSRAANPTSQGVSLRGVGASGASRALVLADGIPLNDPFGGWVTWGRVPRQSVGRVETLRGSASHLYGSAALGGVIQIFTRELEEQSQLLFEASYGNEQTFDASLFMSTRKEGWGASLAAEVFKTDGYFLVGQADRGLVDAPASSRYTTVAATVEREWDEDKRLFMRGSYFGEARENGTRLQFNRTHLRQLVVGGDWTSARAGVFTVRAYASTQVFDQTFSSVSNDRQSETLTRLQRVPSQAAGFLSQWSRAFGTRHALVAGFEAREVRGFSDELGFNAGRPSVTTGAGGRERSVGLFIEDLINITPRLLLSAGVRLDRWRNSEALKAASPVVAPALATVTIFPDRSESALSPSLSLLYKPEARFSLYVSASRAFRAPTLNELYRDFRVGNVSTLANENLRAERLTGAETGTSYNARNNRFTVRGTFFWLEVTRPVANLTLSETPALIVRQRRNLGRTRSRGLELEAEARPINRFSVSAGYQLTDATVVSFPANRTLEGLRVPQVARHNFTFRVDYLARSGFAFGLQGRAAGAQFEDDSNTLRLKKFFTLDAFFSRRLARGIDGFVAAENLLNRRYEVGRTPVTTLGPPLLLRVGLRIRLRSQ